MTPRTKILLLGLAVTMGVMLWCPRAAAPATVRVPRGWARSGARAVQPAAVARAGRNESAAVAAAGPGRLATRREVAAYVRSLYRQEQLHRELDLEQQRYGSAYWQSERDGRERAALQQARAALLAQLSAEANEIVDQLFPGETGEPIVLTAFFDAEQAGPNLSFLSGPLRARLEAAMLAPGGAAGADPESWREAAARVLPAGEMNFYRQWNDPAAAVLRRDLVGFGQNEAEFLALLQETRLAADEGEFPGAAARLAGLLGPARFNAYVRLREPARQTAVHDLERLGLPLDQADWLADVRARAVADFGAIWQNPTLPDAAKRERVAAAGRAYGQAIAARLGLPAGALDGLTPDS